MARFYILANYSGFSKPANIVISIRFRLLELTMGCVLFISIVQFSRIKSLVATTNDSLSNTPFIVKYFFLNIELLKNEPFVIIKGHEFLSLFNDLFESHMYLPLITESQYSHLAVSPRHTVLGAPQCSQITSIITGFFWKTGIAVPAPFALTGMICRFS